MKKSHTAYSTFSSYYIVLFLCIISPALIAQENRLPSLSEETGLERPIASEEYVLMPGDSILVTVTGATNYSYITGVTYEGKVTINLPIAGLQRTQGVYVPQYDIIEAVTIYRLTLIEIKDSLKVVFSKYFRNISVDVTLIGMRRFTVFVVGEVRNPGIVYVSPIDRVSRCLEKAGDPTFLGSHTRIRVMRDGELFKIADLEEFERTGDRKTNPLVRDGDIIVVPQMAKSVIVRGAVFGKRGYELRVSELTAARERASEGIYELNEGETVLDIVRKAGGVTPWADVESAYIVRNGQKIVVNMSEVLHDTNSGYNILMEDADILYLPGVNAVVLVQGQVVAPGPFSFQPNLTASDYIGLAGGPLETADMGRAHVVRGEQGIPVRDNPVIEQGDKIVVPRVTFKFWQDYLEITAVFATLLISFLTLSK